MSGGAAALFQRAVCQCGVAPSPVRPKPRRRWRKEV